MTTHAAPAAEPQGTGAPESADYTVFATDAESGERVAVPVDCATGAELDEVLEALEDGGYGQFGVARR